MAKVSPIQVSFNAGELSPEVSARVDIGKYAAGLTTLENFIPMVQGPARKRAGTTYVASVKYPSSRTWLAKFEFSRTQAYVLEFGNHYLRLFTDDGRLLVGSPAAYNGATAYECGDLVTSSGTVYWCKTAVTGTAPPNTTYWYAQPVGGMLELRTPWDNADLVREDGAFALELAQSGDVMFIAHPSYPPYKLSRRGATTWALEDITLADYGGPFDDYDPAETITVYTSAQTGTVTLTASSAIFASTDVGRLIYLEQQKANTITMWEVDKAVSSGDLRRSDGKTYKAKTSGTTGSIKPTHSSGEAYDGNTGVRWEYQDAGYGWAKITGYTSSTVVTARVQSPFPEQATGSGNASTRWALGSWCDESGWPDRVCFFRNRLCFARSSDRKLWFSVAGDYEDFRDRDESGRVTADMSITLNIESDQYSDAIQYIIPATDLIVGTSGGEHICTEQSDSDPFGPANVRIMRSSGYGGRSVQPLLVGGSVLFVQRSGRGLRELAYDAASEGYPSTDLSVLASHMIPKGTFIRQMTYQSEPYGVVWVARNDGALRGFTFNREQYTDPPYGGWHRHSLGGTPNSGGEHVVVNSLVCVPSPTNNRDDLWMVVVREVNGATVRYVERMVAEWEAGDAIEDAFYLDSALTYRGSPVDAVSPLVIVASGQSNMLGNASATGGTFKSNTDVYAWLATISGGAGAWVQNPNFETTQYYIPGSTSDVGNGVNNAALAFAHRVQEESGRPVRLIIEAKGNQNITQWVGSGTASPRYVALVDRVTEALATLGLTTVDIFLWQQGENNVANSANTYEGYLDDLFTQLEGEAFWDTDTVSVLGELLQCTRTITGITQANPGVISYTGADPAVNDTFTVSGVVGMEELNGVIVKVKSVDTGANTFEIKDTSNVDINTSGYGAYFSGGVLTLANYRNVNTGIHQRYAAHADGSTMYASSVGLEDVGDFIHYSGESLFVLGYERYFDALGYTDVTLEATTPDVSTISGLDHLEGETVGVLADGAVHPDCVVSSGRITLNYTASVVTVGLPYTAKMVTLPIEAGAQDGTAQGKTKRIHRVTMRFLDTVGGKVGPSETTLDTLTFRAVGDPMDQAVPAFTGDKEVVWRGGYEKGAQIWYVHDQPLPATVLAIMPQLVTQDR